MASEGGRRGQCALLPASCAASPRSHACCGRGPAAPGAGGTDLGACRTCRAEKSSSLLLSLPLVLASGGCRACGTGAGAGTAGTEYVVGAGAGGRAGSASGASCLVCSLGLRGRRHALLETALLHMDSSHIRQKQSEVGSASITRCLHERDPLLDCEPTGALAHRGLNHRGLKKTRVF